jgi:hypothetical protein
MVLISIDPFAHRKLFLIVVALLGFSALCFADPVLMAQRYAASPGRREITQVPAPAMPAAEECGEWRVVGPEVGESPMVNLTRGKIELRSTALPGNIDLPPANATYVLRSNDWWTDLRDASFPAAPDKI